MASLEGQRAIKHNIREELSEQEVVDCAESYGPNGCGGGWMNKVFDYIRDHGISLNSVYKYKASRETCVNYATARTNVTVLGTKFISNNTQAFVQAVGRIFNLKFIKVKCLLNKMSHLLLFTMIVLVNCYLHFL